MRTLLDRFLDYVRIDTQSREGSDGFPSTSGQWDLLRRLEAELTELGASDVRLTGDGYVLATIPATSSRPGLPTIAFFAHVDTAPDYPGSGVKPIVHRDYDGGRIALPDDPAEVLDPAEIPQLRGKRGETIVTASGKTLLGADDKSGVAIVMSLAAALLADRSIPHGPIRVCFNPDEEIGRGVEKLDLEELGADVAYTLDAETPGDVQFECFSADKARIRIDGVSIHPGWAKDKLVNAGVLAARLVASFPRDGITPETTEKRQGFIHVYSIQGGAARAEVNVILRDFELDGLAAKGERVKRLCEQLAAEAPRAKMQCQIEAQYRNMRYWLESDMRPVEFARRAIESVGLAPLSEPIRGGTDGARLTERGLPTPNLFTGMHCVHGPLEWIALEDMSRSVDTLMRLVQVWESDGEGYRRDR